MASLTVPVQLCLSLCSVPQPLPLSPPTDAVAANGPAWAVAVACSSWLGTETAAHESDRIRGGGG